MQTDLRRKAYDRLRKWKEESNGSSAMLINGARRVGKSHLAKQFAEREYRDHVIVDFANENSDLATVFRDYNGNIDDLVLSLEVTLGRTLPVRETVIVFDEVQMCPKARQMIKYLVADGRFDYIETGSLLSIKANIQDIVIPSEEDELDLMPLDFEEFLWAVGDELTVPYLRGCLETLKPVGDGLHRKIMMLFRKYMLVGGMPQSVVAFVETGKFERSEAEKTRILSLYRRDVGRFATGYSAKVQSIFDEIPSNLSRKEKRFMLSSISKNARNREYEDAFLWLADAMIVSPCVNATDPTVGLSMNLDMTTQKLYMADTGLLVTQCLNDDDDVDEDLYKSLLLGKIGINEGMFAENIVAQCLRANGRNLFFYSRPAKKASPNGDGDEKRLEIDFLIRRKGKICPVEVKSGDRLTHASLDAFVEKFGKRLGQPYVLCMKDVQEKDGIVYLPLYMASVL